MGDMVSLAWLAEGTRDTKDPISFYATGASYALLRLLGQHVSEEPNGAEVVVSTGYLAELQDGGAKLRLDYMRQLLGISTPHKRPPVQIPSAELNWAIENKAQIGGDLVLLFPQTYWDSRSWPACYWVELAWRLKERNVSPVVMMVNEDKRFTNTPHYFWGFDIAKVAALMSVSKLVVGNDSGPAHLSGTIGIPTIITVGPTRPECVFGHIPEIIALKSEETPDCAGCHFQPPFRAACDQGCQALYALKPHVVLGRIVSELAILSSRAPPQLKGHPALGRTEAKPL
jgi:hypothetical protein